MFCPRQSVSAMAVLVSSVAKENSDGPDVKILKAIAGRLNAKLEIVHAPFKRRLQLMKDGKIDFMSGLRKRSDREVFIHFVHPPYKMRSDTVFFVKKGRASLLRTYADLRPLTVGTNLGSSDYPLFDEDPKLKKKPVPSGVPNFKKLLLGRVDTVIYAESGGIDLIYKMGIANRQEMAAYRFSRTKQVFIGISRQSRLKKRISEVEHVIRDMVETGEIERLIVDYYLSRGLPVPAM